MNKLITLLALVALTGCAQMKTWVPSFSDANQSAKIIDVRGQLHNTIVSEKSLIVRSTGKIVGKIHYSEIEIEKGGEIEGALSQGAEPSPTVTTTPPVAQAAAPVTPAPNAGAVQGKPPQPGN